MLNLDLKILSVSQEGLILHTVEASLLQSICCIGDQLSQEDLLVSVQRVDDDVHQTIHLRLELVFLGRFSHLGPVSITETINNLLWISLRAFSFES